MTTEMPEILTSEQAAGLLQFSTQYVRALAKQGDLPAIQLGDDWRFIKTQVIDYLSQSAIREQQSRKFEHNSQPKDQSINIPARPRGRPRKVNASQVGV